MTAFIFGIFGLIVGSFLNVVVLRKGARSITGRSSCMSCGYMLHWYDMVPVVSWLILLGRCRKCGSRISIQYPLVEASTAGLFALIGGVPISMPLALLCCVIAALLVIITVYDFLHTIIPDEWVWTFNALAFIFAALQFSIFNSQFLILLSGPITAFPLFMLWLVSGGRWMGLGDAKLALGIGWLLGAYIGFIAVMFSFILGTVILIPWMLLQHLITHRSAYGAGAQGLTMKSEVPFGPFLILSCLIFWMSQLYGVALPLPF